MLVDEKAQLLKIRKAKEAAEKAAEKKKGQKDQKRAVKGSGRERGLYKVRHQLRPRGWAGGSGGGAVQPL